MVYRKEKVGVEAGRDGGGQKGGGKRLKFFFCTGSGICPKKPVSTAYSQYTMVTCHLTMEMHSEKMSLHDFCFYVNITAYLHKPR